MGYSTFKYQNFSRVLRAPGFVSGLWRQGQKGEFGPRAIGMTVINKSGSDIAADKLVTISTMDTTTSLPQIVLANASTQGHGDVYVTPAVIHNGKTGIVLKGGLSGKTLNTNGLTAGNAIYLDVNSGGFTGTVPTASNARVHQVGYVVAVSSTVGQVLWDIEDQFIQSSTNELNPQVLQFQKINVPIASFATTHSTPFTFLAAPGANNYILVDSVALAYNYDGTHALTGGGAVTVIYHGGSAVHSSSVAAGQFTASASSVNLLPPITGALAPPVNTGLDISTGTADFTTNSSTGSVDVMIWYSVDQL